ncbi:uncharacterized protein LOC115676295 [Syzygium oleosum]|uniref:uncharacterized protein LOC115676295 n=1 Tax=Syzygium oleosum TaxID=219896 RepID=UPI0011D2B890|nr:uncharacterized protein LOC115676295 [Syzygium oleosum]
MVDHSDVVRLPKVGCIPDISRAYKSLRAIWNPDRRSSPGRIGAGDKPKAVEAATDSSSNDLEANPTSASLRQHDEELGSIHQEEDNMNGIPSYRYSHKNGNHDEEPKSPRLGCFGHRRESFFASMPSPLSRSASRRSQPPTHSSPFKSVSRRSIDSTAFGPASLSRSSSRVSSTPIMFSNSTGMLKSPAIERTLECTLEELCYGCMKKIKVTRDVLTNTGQIIQEEELLTIKVKSGWKKGTKITFQGMGNERPGVQPADITFVIAEKKHGLFRREGDDLELAVEIPLVKALTGCDLSVPLLGGKCLVLTVDEIIYPGYEKVIVGQGMPVPKEQGRRGNLKVVFLVAFPTALTDDRRAEIVGVLEGSV